MEPIRIIENKELLLAGCLVKYEGGDEWAKWEEMDAKQNDDPRYVHHHMVKGQKAHSLWFHLDEAYVFTGSEVTDKVKDTAWEYLSVPKVTYAVFDLDYKIDLDPQYELIDLWVEKNNIYKWTKWDADGKLDSEKFSIYIYDHDGKFKENKIVEFWIPLVKVNE